MTAPPAILGCGWPFPPRPTDAGALPRVSGEEKVRQAIFLILATAPGERRMRPDFGCGIHDLVFQPITATVVAQVRERARAALIHWEPRIDVLDVTVTQAPQAPNCLMIRIDYRIRAINTAANLVYPFFISEGPGGGGPT
jgi:phage baseplate assembly protein W